MDGFLVVLKEQRKNTTQSQFYGVAPGLEFPVPKFIKGLGPSLHIVKIASYPIARKDHIKITKFTIFCYVSLPSNRGCDFSEVTQLQFHTNVSNSEMTSVNVKSIHIHIHAPGYGKAFLKLMLRMRDLPALSWRLAY